MFTVFNQKKTTVRPVGGARGAAIQGETLLQEEDWISAWQQFCSERESDLPTGRFPAEQETLKGSRCLHCPPERATHEEQEEDIITRVRNDPRRGQKLLWSSDSWSLWSSSPTNSTSVSSLLLGTLGQTGHELVAFASTHAFNLETLLIHES